ncbi:hypothetical protein N0V93_005363 [Gnomoniopsis smithogilvyi]|uniref:Uncharacterized protein n=1 Tax=Gnomoniopsis smithogilvyi TaxID=1191159 RepID=A0A9W9CX26_9PEZI|nr:hypothetical protein N0V93_005363 [Gnomoniopsis smithogilvyi]
MHHLAEKRLLQSTGILRSLPATRYSLRPALTTPRAVSTVPRIAETSFWKSLVPKPWRRENRPVRDPAAPKKSWLSKEWNPATFFIIVFLLIGSMSIQMISLRNRFDAHTRRSEVRIGLLREVVEKLRDGEDVDVENVLGSGDPEKEAIWEEVMNEIEKDAAVRNQKNQDKSKTPASSRPTAKTITVVPEPPADSVPAQEQPKGRSAYFF